MAKPNLTRTEPTLLIVIVNYRTADLVIECLRSIEAELYLDSTGDAAVRFVVVLADRAGGGLHNSEDLKKIDAALAEALLIREIERIPYTEFVTESEQRETPPGAGGESADSPVG